MSTHERHVRLFRNGRNQALRMPREGIDKLSYVALHILDNLPCYSAAAYFHDTKARIRSIR
jgi:hypothetical protein